MSFIFKFYFFPFLSAYTVHLGFYEFSFLFVLSFVLFVRSPDATVEPVAPPAPTAADSASRTPARRRRNISRSNTDASRVNSVFLYFNFLVGEGTTKKYSNTLYLRNSQVFIDMPTHSLFGWI